MRPSELLGITDSYAAYCLDEATAVWGTYVTSELDKIEGKNTKSVEARRKARLAKLLQKPEERKFRDPATMVKQD